MQGALGTCSPQLCVQGHHLTAQEPPPWGHLHPGAWLTLERGHRGHTAPEVGVGVVQERGKPWAPDTSSRRDCGRRWSSVGDQALGSRRTIELRRGLTRSPPLCLLDRGLPFC